MIICHTEVYLKYVFFLIDSGLIVITLKIDNLKISATQLNLKETADKALV